MRQFAERFEDAAAARSAFKRAYRYGVVHVESEALEVVVRLAPKTRAQENHYHALIGDIAEQYQHAGRVWAFDDMKRLLVDAFRHETKGNPEFEELQEAWAQVGDVRLVPAIGRDGFVALGDQTRKFPKKLAAAFITWLLAFMSENGIVCSDPKWANADAEPRR